MPRVYKSTRATGRISSPGVRKRRRTRKVVGKVGSKRNVSRRSYSSSTRSGGSSRSASVVKGQVTSIRG